MSDLVRKNPSLLPAAPPGVTGQMIDFRREDEVHDCLVCGERAGAAFVADTSEGPRWLDLCMSHSDEVRRLPRDTPRRGLTGAVIA